MDYISVAEAAKKWEISDRTIRNYCQSGKIVGAMQIGNSWMIPANAQKPGKKIELENDDQYLNGLVDFLNSSPVSFFAIKNACDILNKNGYKKLEENKVTPIKQGDKIYFVRNGTSLVALNIGKAITEDNYPFHIIASHSDSPTFKLKPAFESKTDVYQKVSVEPYGGMLCSTWLDRPLSVSGRVIVKFNNTIESKLLNIDKDLLMIPNLCIHFNRDANKGYSYNMAEDMQPYISAFNEANPLKGLIANSLQISENQIINYDLYLYNRQKATIWGVDNEFISSGRLDDLECVYTSLMAFTNSTNDCAINVLYISDNEEVGSSSAQGADGDFLDLVMRRIQESLKYSSSSLSASAAGSFLVSADNAHAVHPNKAGVTDSNNHCYMNKGIAIKFNAAQSYTSDAVSSSLFQSICEKANVPYQFFTNRSDIRGGSTLGNILLSHVSMLSVDIGLPQLAMHSSYETAGTKDVTYAIKAFEAFYSTSIIKNGDTYNLK